MLDCELWINRFTAGVTVKGRESFLRIRMNGEMAFREQYENCCSLGFKLFGLYRQYSCSTYLSSFYHLRLQPFCIVEKIKIDSPSVYSYVSSES